ncbi:MAG: diguanylate cyclase (GGDEF)-like protein/PAS domain S-box-containing protein [Reinekea sp.]|jgi:diguanylate cyclase (GGDEF)-like protein/PAS domain S-box-containing protein
MNPFTTIRTLVSRQISLRLAITFLVTAVGLSLMVGTVQFVVELKQHASLIEQDIERIGMASIYPAKQAVFRLDSVLGAEIVKGLLMNRFVTAVWIFDEQNTSVAFGHKRQDRPYRAPYLVPFIGEPVRYYSVELGFDPSDPVNLGTLKFEYNNHWRYQSLMRATWSRLLLTFVEVICLTLILIGIVRRSLTRPLVLLSDQLKHIDINHSQGQRLTPLNRHRDDELGTLINALNSYIGVAEALIGENRAALTAAEQSYTSLHALVEHLPHLIYVKTIGGRVLLANRAFLKTFELDEQTFIGGRHDLVLGNFSASTQQLIKDADDEAYESRKSVLLPEVNWTLKNGQFLSLEVRKLAIQYKGQDALLTVGVDITERREHQAYIQHLAYHDSLTNLPNRHLFLDRLDQALLRAQRSGNFGALIFIDLDNFKAINDTKGHLVGDSILSTVAERLKEGVREQDTVARLGGDEFVICMTDLGCDEVLAREIAVDRTTRLIAAMARPFKIPGDCLQVSASLGLAFFYDRTQPAEELLRHADMAMYKAKESGKNQLILFEQEMADSNQRVLELKEDCLVAITEHQFFLLYQPQVDSNNGRIVGTEALLRWAHPTRGLVSPAEFIPLLEAADLMHIVGQFVLREAIAQAAHWQQTQLIDERFKVSINVSPQQFRHENFTQIVRDIVTEQGIDPNMLDLEITEGMIIDDIDHTVASMNELRAMGLHFSIDDFGTGYSNLNYLKQLPLDALKVDQSFVRNIQHDPNDTAIVRTILAMAAQLNLNTVAEGVETEAQLTLLRDMGCHVFQGYLYSPPILPVEFEQLLNNQKKGPIRSL